MNKPRFEELARNPETRFYVNPRKLEAIRLKLNGLTYKEIGEQFGVTRQRAQRLVMAPSSVQADVRSRNKGCCQDCKVYIPVYPEQGCDSIRGSVHHDKITSTPELYNHPSNLVYLCIACHRNRHAKGTA